VIDDDESSEAGAMADTGGPQTPAQSASDPMDRPDTGIENGPEPASNRNRWDRSRLLQVGGLAVMGIGLLMPWIAAGFISVNGIDTGDGKLFGILLLAAAGMVWFHETRHGRWRIAASLSGALLLVFAVYEIIHVYDNGGTSILTVSPGSGLWLDALGAAALLFGAWTAKDMHRGSRDGHGH
jgi:hypothetical protein